MNQVKANRVIALKLKLNKHNKSAAPKKKYIEMYFEFMMQVHVTPANNQINK